jgi:hypothetical protein
VKKFSLRVSGSRVGDTARPVESSDQPIALIKAPRFGLKVHRSPLAPKAAQSVTSDDYATAEDYE